jgi:Mitochondrial protein up-regulated during meiosis
VGNVNLAIQSERMVKNGTPTLARRRDNSWRGSNEKLIVRWRTCGKTKGLGTGANFRGVGARQTVDKITMWLGGTEKRDDEEFCGLFIFEFDEEGRISNHVIERAEGDDGWDAEPSKWIGLTDWLLGRFGKGFNEREPGLALGYQRLGRKRNDSCGASARRV